MALSFTVTPGYNFSASEKVTYPKLNLLGSPTITLAGTLDTSQLSDGAVTTAKLASSIDINSKIADHNLALSKLAAGTQGQILYCNASGDWSVLSPGTAGQFLKTSGAGADPAWANQTSLSTIPISMIVAGGTNTVLKTNGSKTVAWEAQTAGTIVPATDPYFISMEFESGSWVTQAKTVSGGASSTPSVTSDTGWGDSNYNSAYDGQFVDGSGTGRNTIIGLQQATDMGNHEYINVSVPIATFTAMYASVTAFSQVAGVIATVQHSGTSAMASGAFYKLGSEYVPLSYHADPSGDGFHHASTCTIPVAGSLDLRLAVVNTSKNNIYAQAYLKITHLILKS